MTADTTFLISNMDKLTAYTSKTNKIEKDKVYYDTISYVETLDNGIEAYAIIKSFSITEGEIFVEQYFETEGKDKIRFYTKDMVGITEEGDFIELESSEVE